MKKEVDLQNQLLRMKILMKDDADALALCDSPILKFPENDYANHTRG